MIIVGHRMRHLANKFVHVYPHQPNLLLRGLADVIVGVLVLALLFTPVLMEESLYASELRSGGYPIFRLWAKTDPLLIFPLGLFLVACGFCTGVLIDSGVSWFRRHIAYRKPWRMTKEVTALIRDRILISALT
jgi:hypothetical protein